MTHPNPNREQISSLLLNARTIAVVGLSDKPSRPSFDVATALLGFGYRVIPVTPRLKAWEGIDAVPDLATAKASVAANERIDIVNVFRQSQHVAGIVDECLRLALPVLWLQLGVSDEAAAMRAQSAGMTVIMNMCIKVERMRIKERSV